MRLLELVTQVKDILQDTDSDYWSESELVDYFNHGTRTIASERKEKPTITTVDLYEATNEYTVDGVLRYISAVDSNSIVRELYPDDKSGDNDNYGIIIQDYDKIYVNTPSDDVTLSIKSIVLPLSINLEDEVRDGDENALKYFVLSKAYEKEHDMENFQKSQYFLQLYMKELSLLLGNSRLGYMQQVEITEGYYY